jgi:hypothetical protein
MTTWRMRTACWIRKTKDKTTHTEYVILIAFPLQQWLDERASVLFYTILPVMFMLHYKQQNQNTAKQD